MLSMKLSQLFRGGDSFLRKTSKAFEAEKKAWRERVDQGFKHLAEIGSKELLQSLLGDVFSLVGSLDGRGLLARAEALVPRSTPSNADTLPPLATVGASRINQAGVEPLAPITNRKRPAIVDLTNDSD